MSDAGLRGRVCQRTGLYLIDSNHLDKSSWRIASSTYGPVNPPVRASVLSEVDAGWGRFDVLGGRTIYMAQQRLCALAEVLACFRRDLGSGGRRSKDAAFLGMSDSELAAAIEREWRERTFLRPGQLPAGWRLARNAYQLSMPTGWWVRADDIHTMQALEEALEVELASLSCKSLDLSVLTGSSRPVTVTAATWVRSQELDDGSLPLGILYPSRHGAGNAYAYWLRRMDDGATADVEDVMIMGTEEISEDDVDLRAVARRFRLRVF